MRFRKLSSLLLTIALLAVLPLYQALAKGVVNEPEYTYTEAICTKGRDDQKKLCQSLSAEALVFRLHKGFTDGHPDPTFYAKWVRKIVNQKTNPIELANLLATQYSNNFTTAQQVSELYSSLQCKNPSQMSLAINQWAKQIDAGKQTRAQVALYLAKKRDSATCLGTSWQAFIDSVANVDLNSTDDPDQTLQDVSLSCEVASGASSCTTTAPQYCLNTLSVQPAHGTSVISGSTMTYTKSGSATTPESYAHLRQNGNTTAKCNVSVTFATSTTTLQDVSLSCEVASGASSCTTTAPQYCLNTLSVQPAHGTSVISGSTLTYTKSGSSTTTENYAHLRQNGSATAKCNVSVTFAAPANTLQDVSVTCALQYNPSNQVNQCVIVAPQYCQVGLVTQPAHGTSTISGGNLIYQMTGSSTAEENYAHLRQNGTETAKCNIKITFTTTNTDNTKKFHIAIIGAGYDENSQAWQNLSNEAKVYLMINPALSEKSSQIVFHTAADLSNLGCSGGDGTNPNPELRAIYCDSSNSYSTVENFVSSKGINADKVVVLLASNNSGTAQGLGSKYSTTGMAGGQTYDRLVSVLQHEFGHNMGLTDEYYYSDPPTSSNYTSPSIGQCESSPPGPWASITTAQWTIGCGYSNLYRPSLDSIMRGYTSYEFNDVSKEVMRRHLAQYLN